MAQALKFLGQLVIWLIENNPELKQRLVQIILDADLKDILKEVSDDC